MKRCATAVPATLVLAAAAALPSCAATAGRVAVPEAAAVERVVVTAPVPGTEMFEKRETVIDDPENVGRFLAFLRAHGDGWRKPWDTFPMPQYTAAIYRGEDLLMVVWVGRTWIGGFVGEDDNRWRSISDAERAEVLEILGIPKE